MAGCIAFAVDLMRGIVRSSHFIDLIPNLSPREIETPRSAVSYSPFPGAFSVPFALPILFDNTEEMVVL